MGFAVVGRLKSHLANLFLLLGAMGLESKPGVRVKSAAGPWGEVMVGEIPFPAQTRSKHRLDFQNPTLSREIR